MLGPARFAHIETCAREVCHAFKIKDEIEDCVVTLTSLDDILVSLRAELAELRGETAVSDKPVVPTKKKQDYKDLVDGQDIARAKRLVTARENAIKSVKSSIAKEKQQKPVVAGTLLERYKPRLHEDSR